MQRAVERITKDIKEEYTRDLVAGTFCGAAAFAFFVLPDVPINSRYEYFALFLLLFGLYLLVKWWYPIYIGEK